MNDKYKSAVHYIIDSCQDPFLLGSIKLNKILFYSDSAMFIETNNSITNDVYIKRQYGPVPKNIVNILKELESEKKIAISKKKYENYNHTVFFSLEEVDFSLLSAKEVAILNQNKENICNNYTAKSISFETHNEIWQMANIGEEIPLYTIYASNLGEINEDDIKFIEEAMNAGN
ncbi:type II toxin-antitoxin system antitoxin SocA domain-containing protein [Brachyspira alvinipulli]|uniref:type II toxin-antitoxin system antitoxin SocA domain-containing protein n=1 Tax=Brachyspira alvinipulli TaxID=84379 RepID=UPI0004B1A5F4|nr:Panacea domain-containing protein [Brachyspira alvinipulli]